MELWIGFVVRKDTHLSSTGTDVLQQLLAEADLYNFRTHEFLNHFVTAKILSFVSGQLA